MMREKYVLVMDMDVTSVLNLQMRERGSQKSLDELIGGRAE